MLLLALMFLGACGRESPNLVGGAVTIQLASVPAPPLPTTLVPGTVATVTATVYDQSNQGVTWSVAPLNFGTLSAQTSSNRPSNYQTTASVTYTAPIDVASNTTVTITATSISDPNISASLPIRVTPVVVSLQLLNAVTDAYVPAAAQVINQGDQLSIDALVLNQTSTNQNVTWTLSPATGDGSLASGPTPGSITYLAPTPISAPITATITAASVASPGAVASMRVTVLPSGAGPNVAALIVDGGPVLAQAHPNRAFTSVSICNPGDTIKCQTVDGILVDTASYGLRILQSQIPLLKLPALTDGSGNTLDNCVSHADGSFLWGPVSTADVYITGELAQSTLIQVISSSNSSVPSSCSNGGAANDNTPELLGANGILGIGPEPTDCTLAGVNLCDGSAQATPPDLYYSCPSTGCLTTDSSVIVSANQQVINPVTRFQNLATFSHDDNGMIFQFPPVSGPQSTLVGTLTFGIGTESNNALGNQNIFTLDSHDHFTTLFSGQTLTNSLIDSGSDALLFPDSLPACAVNTHYFCPTSLTDISPKMEGGTLGESKVTFTVGNADSLFSANPGYSVFGGLTGPNGTYQSCSGGTGSCVFDWGMPFFYGRTVFSAIDGQVLPGAPPPPWWAY